jgi:formate dehydrogenase subunit delta
MEIQRLIKMANEIGAFFKSAEQHHEAVASIAAHLRNFWDPRMRAQLLEYAHHHADHAHGEHAHGEHSHGEHANGHHIDDDHSGDGELTPIVKEAVLTLVK